MCRVCCVPPKPREDELVGGWVVVKRLAKPDKSNLGKRDRLGARLLDNGARVIVWQYSQYTRTSLRRQHGQGRCVKTSEKCARTKRLARSINRYLRVHADGEGWCAGVPVCRCAVSPASVPLVRVMPTNVAPDEVSPR